MRLEGSAWTQANLDVLKRWQQVIDARRYTTDDSHVSAPHSVSIIVFPGVQPLDVVGPHEVFAGANQVLGRAVYDVQIQAAVAGPVRGESGLVLVAQELGLEPPNTLIIAGGTGVFAATKDQTLISWIQRQAATTPRIASVCTGTFLLAEAGLLNGRTVTTHWARADRFARDYPQTTVDQDPIFINDANLWTSAGVTAGMDMSLAMVAEDHGGEVAQTIARWLVMFSRRSGGQSQFATAVWSRSADHEPVRATLDLIHADPSRNLSIENLARAANLSKRHFTRVFTEHVGHSPGRYVDQIRVEQARQRLERTNETVAAVAQACGFGTSETMRRSFLRQLRVSPDRYRQNFSVTTIPS